MAIELQSKGEEPRVAATRGIENLDVSFLPRTLTAKCQSLIESYHALHGYGCLPDLLWKAGLGPFIANHREFGPLLKRASTSRSAKQSNQCFVEIAKTILALEVLASGLAGWRANYPRAALKAEALLRGATRGPRMSLRQFYLYPAKHDASAATAEFFPPGVGSPGGSRLRYPWQAAMTGADLDIADDVGETQDAGLPDPIAELL